MATAYTSALPHRGAQGYRAPAPPSQPAGTFLPGTKVQVGSQRVVIEKYLSEGGFAHVYVVRVPRDGNKHELAVLKRVAVPDKEHLASMRTEVETMKKLKGHIKVVTYMDSHASQLKGGGYEVFLLMEYCGGGGLIDFMNTRLQHRLTEPEILKIFGDVAEGVACMHYLKPPLLHRDLKVENVLISKPVGGGTPTYKLCDFGSAAQPRPAAKTADEGRLIEEDVQKHTTMQYRSPEMIDVWRKQPIDEKADIWALGVLLYKLCYYTTPFEDVGQMAILNASYKYPAYPSFSERLKKFIAWMLKEDPKSRPNIYQVIKEACSMRGVPVPIKDIYANRTQSEARRNESLPSLEPTVSSPPIGLQKAAPSVQVQSLPDIAPMRRGRPTSAAQQAPVAAKPNPSPARGDPFAALDSKNFNVRAGAVDELSKKYPSLDEFTIAHDKSGNFPFSQASPKLSNDRPGSGLNDRVANALADEAFGQFKPRVDVPKSQSTSGLQQQSRSAAAAAAAQSRVASQKPEALKSPVIQQPIPVRSAVNYTSTGTNPSPPPSKPRPQQKMPEISNKPIWRVPDQSRSTSQPRASDAAQAAAASLRPSLPPSKRPALLDMHRSKSQTASLVAAARSPTSSRPSLEGHKRPSELDLGDSVLSRTKSAQVRQRPSSVYLSNINSDMDFLRDRESSRKRSSMDVRRSSRHASQDRGNNGVEDAPIDSDMDYLRNNEEGDASQGKASRKEWGHKKRSSLGGSISGAKNMFAGKFSDAFKRFEKDPGDSRTDAESAPTTPQPQEENEEEEPRLLLSPVPGSEATASRHSDNGSALDETEDLPPDVRRELERQRLSQEEKRVAEAAAQYRARADGPDGAQPSRASTIQKRVQSLLDEGRQSPIKKKTAEGYGRYTSETSPTQEEAPRPETSLPKPKMQAPADWQQAAPADANLSQIPKTRQPAQPFSQRQQPQSTARTPSSPPAQAQPRIVSRPSVPPKSQALRTGTQQRQWPPASQPQSPPQSPPAPIAARPTGLAALLAKDLEGVPDYPPSRDSDRAARESIGGKHNGFAAGAGGLSGNDGVDEAEQEFSQRYPSLAGLEMVEREIVGRDDRGLRVKDV